MKFTTMLVSAHTPSNVPKAAEVSRTRSNQSDVVPAPRQGPGYAASSSGKVNKVLFTIPWSVHFGESLSVSGEGSELGSWNPDESLPLKWNEGNLWAAEVSLPTGEKREYKYVIKDPNGCLKAWQPGENCAVEVPTEADASLQVADDWHGKARSVIYKDGEVQTAPVGTYDGPPAQASAETAVPHPTSHSNTTEANHFPAGAVSTTDVSPALASVDSTTDVSPASASADSTTPVSPASAQAAQTQANVQANGSALEPKLATQAAKPRNKTVDDETGVPLEELPVKALQQRLRSRKQKVSGRKAELIDRLQSMDP